MEVMGEFGARRKQGARVVYAQVSHPTVPASSAVLVSADFFARFPQGPRRRSKKGRLCLFDAAVSHASAFPPHIRTRPEKLRDGPDGGGASRSRERASPALVSAVFPPDT